LLEGSTTERLTEIEGSFPIEQIKAHIQSIKALRAKSMQAFEAADLIIAFERGGPFLADQLLAGSQLLSKVTKVGKVADSNNLHQAQEFVSLVGDMMKPNPGQQARVVFVETFISGSSFNFTTQNAIKQLLTKYPGLTIEVVVLQQTTNYVDRLSVDELVSGNTKNNVATEIELGRLIINSEQVKVIVGEDVDFLLSIDHPDSKKPILLYNSNEGGFESYEIRPTGDTYSREVLIDLLTGKYKGKVGGIH
jgi:hypothetical protein